MEGARPLQGDVMFALALGSIHLRINSIELGLKHIPRQEMGRPVPKKHDLVILWNSLTDEWKEKVAERPASRWRYREALGQYKDAAVALRYGGSLGEQTAQSPVADTMRKHAAVLQKLANTLGGRAHPGNSASNDLLSPRAVGFQIGPRPSRVRFAASRPGLLRPIRLDPLATSRSRHKRCVSS